MHSFDGEKKKEYVIDGDGGRRVLFWGLFKVSANDRGVKKEKKVCCFAN